MWNFMYSTRPLRIECVDKGQDGPNRYQIVRVIEHKLFKGAVRWETEKTLLATSNPTEANQFAQLLVRNFSPILRSSTQHLRSS